MKDKSSLRSLLVASATAASVAHGENVLCIRDPDPSTPGTDTVWYRTTNYAFADKILNAVTLAIWVKDASAQFETFIAGVDERWRLCIPNSGRRVAFITEFGDIRADKYVLDDGKWHFLVGTYNYDSSNPSLCSQRLYVDGVLAAEKTDSLGTFSTPTREFSIGAQANGFNSWGNWCKDCNASFAELSVWNRALSAAQVKALYERTTRLCGNESGLVAYWPLTGDVGMANADFSFPNAAASTGVPDITIGESRTGIIEADDDFTLPYVRCVASPEWCAAKGYVQAEGATGRSWADPLTNLVEVAAAAKPFERILCSPGTHLIESEMSALVSNFRLGSQDSGTMEPCPETAVIDAQGLCRHFISTSDNSAHQSGFLLENLTFANGRASDGGSIFGECFNCLFDRNWAVQGGAASSASLWGCTVVRSRAVDFAAVYVSTAYSCIFWGNKTSNGRSNYWLQGHGECCFEEEMEDYNVSFTGDPLFVDPENGDFRLREDSPCIDAGWGDVLDDEFDVRGDGYPRRIDALGGEEIADMGCYEGGVPLSQILQPPTPSAPRTIQVSGVSPEVA